MKMMNYVVIGAGMQGTAAAYDLVMFGNAKQVILADKSYEVARLAAEKINKLCSINYVIPREVDVDFSENIRDILNNADACLSAVPYFLNPKIAKVCIETSTHFNDLGGNDAATQEILSLHDRAVLANVSLIPDCGVAPGMVNILANMLIEESQARNSKEIYVSMAVGGLPQNKKLPLGYKLVFSPEGLLNEYTGNAVSIEGGGNIVHREALSSVNDLYFDSEFPQMESFPTSGGTSNCPEIYSKTMKNIVKYEYNTIRYKGHHNVMMEFKNLGFLEKESELYRTLLTTFRKMLDFPEEKDVILLEIYIESCNTPPDNIEKRLILKDKFDSKTQFSAMERTTAFSASIITIAQAHNIISSGASTPTFAINSKLFYNELLKRGFNIQINEY